MPHLSSGLIMAGTPSRIRVLVTGSILTSVVSGTCFMQTTIFMSNVSSYLTGTGDDHALDLTGAFSDLGDLGVPHHALHGIVTGVAVTTEELDGLGETAMAVSAATV